MRHQADAAYFSQPFLADSRAEDVPLKGLIFGSDGGDEFRGGKFGDLCRSLRSPAGIHDGRQLPI